MALLLAICGDKHDLSVKEVPLTANVVEEVNNVFVAQELTFPRWTGDSIRRKLDE